ncbi:ABC transporter permease [Nocardiopsis composta]|uniref:ABC-2 type transport system permease protein n=1 Tax=Nocardiopsis composta TaxID=157465 RepID=A0A7W8VF89_9ACTN|nr:ABC transporter permease [Nocardiopsis composta]MBB5434321.1 ABC-2 type transport system permease protein [Nocardiopsis composta]
MALSAPTPTGDRASGRPAGAARRPVPAWRQTLRMTRVELLLFYRYRTAAYIAVVPLFLLFPALTLSGQDNPAGIDAGAFYTASVFILTPITLGIMHMPNVYAARRESMLLKRYRVAGVPASALFGATTLAVSAVVAVLCAVIAAVLVGRFGEAPADPVLLALGIALCTVQMCLFGALFTNLARNAESAQMISMVPFLGMLLLSGSMIPVDFLPEAVRTGLSLLPFLPAVDLVRSAYFGQDLFAGAMQAEALGGLGLWAASLPALLVMAVWTAIAAYLLRFFRWDPRQGG